MASDEKYIDQDQPSPKPNEYIGICSLCSALPDDITVNTGREEYFPGARNHLIGMDNDYRAAFLRCPGCKTYFNWIDMPQMYGSGNCDEERLVRLSPEKSRLLDTLFTTDSNNRPDPNDITEYMEVLPLDLLLPALSFRMHRTPDFVAPFIPQLVQLLGKNNDTSLWSLLNSYVSNKPERAEEILEAFRSSDEYGPTRLAQILRHSLKVARPKK